MDFPLELHDHLVGKGQYGPRTADIALSSCGTCWAPGSGGCTELKHSKRMLKDGGERLPRTPLWPLINPNKFRNTNADVDPARAP